MPSSHLTDLFGRTIVNLRISVTDRCNFRCRYCMPEEGMTWLNKRELLSYEEITRLAGIFSDLGVTRLRLTGGEPLMRNDVATLVEMLTGIPGIDDIAMTTNGFFLAEHAMALKRAGLSRITVSLDSLDPVKFAAMVRRDYFGKVMGGIRAAEEAGLAPVKINMVVIRGMNDNEIEQFAEMARTNSRIVRFIEFMPIGANDGWSMEKIVPSHEIIERINRMGHPLVPIEYHGKQPADRYKFDDGKGEVGFISSVTEPFCSSCDRVRITSDGKLRTCLFSLHETNLKSLLRSGATDDRIKELLIAAVREKEEGHLINRPGFVRPDRTMSQIGG
ncbi:MAG TPA: GTP 3',8-cyclase MoaA [Bacteroidota bacterium]|nr:GTP 3',8-cyclase MoaA [Bacteroidota bacterium]